MHTAVSVMDVRHIPLLAAILVAAIPASAQSPGHIGRGSVAAIAGGTLDGNLIHTVFYNHGSLGWQSGVWPGTTGGPHMEEVAFIAAAAVPGERTKWSSVRPEWAGKADTVLTPVSIGARQRGKDALPYSPWGWLPLPGYHNPRRINPLTGMSEPVPALSSDPGSWPPFWPDRLNEAAPGWSQQWNGFAGRGVLQADLESYYVMDDAGDLEYTIDPTTGLPFSQYGVFYPDPSESAPHFTGGFIDTELPFHCRNVIAGTGCELLVYDVNANAAWDLSDELVISERQGVFGVRLFRYRASISLSDGETSTPPRRPRGCE
ncbi:MAG TPA: hypothetical protein VF190_01205 [Rhodothermales bacterium]